ncbi:hypothetical protein [Rhizobium leguminosarum]|uniref:hypothetical protein n=1 Tax=Rhizobium leguminosarum TaxID=384 RepID=UPI001181ECF6|nr:hypothetical protein [Rhizobium leguminosarum]
MTHQQGSAAWILAQACFSNIYGFKAELNRERVFVFGKINDGALKPNPRSLVEFEILSGHVVGIDGRRRSCRGRSSPEHRKATDNHRPSGGTGIKPCRRQVGCAMIACAALPKVSNGRVFDGLFS